jgi:hypothetical protein
VSLGNGVRIAITDLPVGLNGWSRLLASILFLQFLLSPHNTRGERVNGPRLVSQEILREADYARIFLAESPRRHRPPC